MFNKNKKQAVKPHVYEMMKLCFENDEYEIFQGISSTIERQGGDSSKYWRLLEDEVGVVFEEFLIKAVIHSLSDLKKSIKEVI